MEKKIEAGTPLTIAGVTLVPVLETSTKCWETANSFYCFGTKQPKYIVALNGLHKKVFKPSGEEVPLDQVVDELPDFEYFS